MASDSETQVRACPHFKQCLIRYINANNCDVGLRIATHCVCVSNNKWRKIIMEYHLVNIIHFYVNSLIHNEGLSELDIKETKKIIVKLTQIMLREFN